MKAAVAPNAPWTEHDTWMLAVVGISIAVVVLLISWAKVHAFLALTVGSFAVSLLSGTELDKAADAFSDGFGETLGDAGVLILFGAILGRLLADSGGIDQIVRTLTRFAGPKRLPWALTLVAAIVGIPMFFEVGFVMLVPLVLQLARRGGHPVVRVGIPVMAGLATVHALVPPHPGPLVAIQAVHAPMGLTLGLGLLVAVPCAIIVGPLFTAHIWPRVRAEIPEDVASAFTTDDGGQRPGRTPRFSVTLATILLPVVLMLLKAVVRLLGIEHGPLHAVLGFLGTPVVALLLAVLVALFTLGYGVGAGRQGVQDSLARSFGPIAGVVVIVGAGGGYKQALEDSGVNDAIGLAAHHLHMPLLVLAWLVAALMRTAVGSGTVATVATSGIVAPLAQGLDGTHAALVVLAIGAGAAFLGHVNDAAFWMFRGYFGLTIGGTLRTWTASHALLSVSAILCVLLLDLVV